ncbi:uncharacterized protein KIAA0513-like [Saccoglossus kowalevskii]
MAECNVDDESKGAKVKHDDVIPGSERENGKSPLNNDGSESENEELNWKYPRDRNSGDSGCLCNGTLDTSLTKLVTNGNSDSEELNEVDDDVFMHSDDLNSDCEGGDMLATEKAIHLCNGTMDMAVNVSACQPCGTDPVCAIIKQDFSNEHDSLTVYSVNSACRVFDFIDESTEADSMPLGENGSLSECSDSSWNSTFSTESHQDELSVQCKEFMAIFVHLIFSNSGSITQTEKAKFGRLCQHSAGRLWFSRHVNAQRVNSQKVSEQIFYRLVQFFAVCLFECDNADDFVPAKSLMNMCFTFYHEHEANRSQPIPGLTITATGFPRNEAKTTRGYLYSFLKDQPIWQSLRFWNAAFFDAVHCEREQRSPIHRENWRRMTSAEREDTLQQDENITFGQLVTFTNNMMSFGLTKDLCLKFFEKQSVIGNLSEGKLCCPA